MAVVGQVGAGKSSLVQALLGEMEKISGTVTVKVSIIHLLLIDIVVTILLFLCI